MEEELRLKLSVKKVGIARYSLPLIVLLLVTVCGTVSAVAYILYQFSVNVTVQSNPDVTFWNWGTGMEANTFSYGVTIFPDIKTIDENITYGIVVLDASGHTCSLRIGSVVTPANIAKLNVTIYDSSGTIYTKEWTDFSALPTSWESFPVGANKKYAIWMEITGATGATPGSTSDITFDMKLEV